MRTPILHLVCQRERGSEYASLCQESEQELIQERDTRALYLGLAGTFLGRKTYFMFQGGVFVYGTKNEFKYVIPFPQSPEH